MTTDPIPWDQPGADAVRDLHDVIAAENRRARLGILDRATCRSCGYSYLPRAYPADVGLCDLCSVLTDELESISKERADQGVRDPSDFPDAR